MEKALQWKWVQQRHGIWMGWGEVATEKEKGKGKRKVEAKGHGQLARGQNNGRISMLVDLTYLGLACLCLAVLLFRVVVVIPAHHTLWPFLNLTDTSRTLCGSSR